MYTRLWSTTLLCALGGSGTAWTQTFNPRAYGAKGDGAADDTPAINAALAAVPAAGGGLELSPGGYRLTAPLRLAEKSILEGAGVPGGPPDPRRQRRHPARPRCAPQRRRRSPHRQRHRQHLPWSHGGG